MVWSPLSNLLLYGQTADVAAAKAAGLTIGLGSDWSPSGSKNLLGELKAAQACNRAPGGPFSARDMVAMATSNEAKLRKWEKGVGSLLVEIGSAHVRTLVTIAHLVCRLLLVKHPVTITILSVLL